MHHEKGIRLKDCCKFAQRLVEDVWKRWIRHYRPTRMTRHEWHHLQRSLKDEDVVLLVVQNQ